MSDKLIWVMDAGNTNIKSGIFQDEKLLYTWRLTTDGDRTADEYGILMMQMFQIHRIPLEQIEGIIISSVVPSVNFNLDRMCRKHFGHTPLFVGPGIKTGLNIRIDNPKELGADITANAVAAWHYCHSAAVVIDFGTATTFFALSAKCELLGGAIFPGVKVASEALITHTSQLPRFELQRPENCIGRNTVHSLQAGMIYGYKGVVESIAGQLKRELGEPDAPVFATGGMSTLMSSQTDIITDVHSSLTLEGLRLIYEKNRPE